MKHNLRKLFRPILNCFESDQPPATYKPSYRTILMVVGVLFLILSAGSAAAVIYTGMVEALIPVIVFFAIGAVALIVAGLGSDSAVAKIWGKGG